MMVVRRSPCPHEWNSETLEEWVFDERLFRTVPVEVVIMTCDICGEWYDDMDELEDGSET